MVRILPNRPYGRFGRRGRCRGDCRTGGLGRRSTGDRGRTRGTWVEVGEGNVGTPGRPYSLRTLGRRLRPPFKRYVVRVRQSGSVGVPSLTGNVNLSCGTWDAPRTPDRSERGVTSGTVGDRGDTGTYRQGGRPCCEGLRSGRGGW